jgi:epoxyqueuosine reductase
VIPALAAERLAVLGGFHPTSEDDLPAGTQTLLLIGPDGPGFWPHFAASPEASDCNPDPLDRWSRRVIGRIACDLGGKALFPFGGPPHRPFYAWALRTGRCHPSPVALLVHDVAGLFVSFRGALALQERLDLPPAPPNPCYSCADRPCLTACPVGALTERNYDLSACHGFLDTSPGQDCMTGGCAVRRACPVSARHGRLPAQSAFHMRNFHP